MSPRQASHFLLLRQKKVTKEKATPLAASLRFAPGSLRCSLFTGSAQTRFAQTRAALIREKLRSSATARGELNINAPWRVLLWSARERALRVLAHAAHTHTHMRCSRPRAARPLEAEQRDGPSHLPSARAEERSFRRMKGRACLSEASLRGPRLKRAPQVARSEAKGHAQWGRLSLVTFFGETKKVTRPPGRHPGSGLGTNATHHQAPDALTPTLSQREREQDRRQHWTFHAPPPRLVKPPKPRCGS